MSRTLTTVSRCAAFGLLLSALPDPAFAAGLPDAAKLFRRAIERAQNLADDAAAPVYLFDKRTTIATLDSKGKVTQRKIKLFEVTMTGGVPEERLVALEGKKLSAKEIAREQEKSSRWRRKFEQADDQSKRRSFVPADMVAKFEFGYLRAEDVNDRPNHVISFKPRSPAVEASSFGDRIVNQLSGTMWFDAADSEITRVEVRLGEKVNLWAGLLGALYKFEFKLDRRRSSEGVWYNQDADISLDARGLLKRLRMHIVERSSNFRRAPKVP